MARELTGFILAYVAIAAFGAPLAFTAVLRSKTIVARAGFAFLGGSVVLTSWMTLLSIAGVRWSIASIGIPLLVISSAGSILLARRKRPEPRFDIPPVDALTRWAWLLTVAAVVYLAIAGFSTYATSADYLFFWGAKAARFVAAGGFDARFLNWEYAVHMHPSYPQLVPAVYGWQALMIGRHSWSLGLTVPAIWLFAGAVTIESILSEISTRRVAAAFTAFWSLAIALSLVDSWSAGNAEAPLLVFATVAAVLLFSTRFDVSTATVAGVCLGGALLTKTEGVLIVGAFIAAALIQRWIERRRMEWLSLATSLGIAAVSLGLWIALELLAHIPIIDPQREYGGGIHWRNAIPIVGSLLENMPAGSYWLAWLVPLIALLVFRGRIRTLLPYVIAGGGLLAAYYLYFLRLPYEPTQLIVWTFPRISQPTLSLWIVGAALATGENAVLQEWPGARIDIGPLP